MSDPAETGVSRGSRFVGWLLIAIGVLITALCGVCTASVLVVALSSGGSDESMLLSMDAVMGGVPTLVGIAIIFAGRVVLRPRDPSPPER